MMGKLLQHMKKKNKVIAIDTFEGMPAATEKDKTGNFFYDTGMFKETSRERIETQKNKEGLQSYVQLCQGLAQDVLPQISNENRHLHFMLLDTDQYVGTMSGIKTLLSRKDSSWFALIDDTTVSGVDYAIQEALDANPWLKRKSLFHNFDLMYSDRTEFGW
jgi:hypothetical protein